MSDTGKPKGTPRKAPLPRPAPKDYDKVRKQPKPPTYVAALDAMQRR